MDKPEKKDKHELNFAGGERSKKNVHLKPGNQIEKRSEHFTEIDFAERALLTLARKNSDKPEVLAEWERAIVDADPISGCVTIPR
jgi:hypothetical protein